MRRLAASFPETVMAFGRSETAGHMRRWSEATDDELVAGLRAGYLEAFDEFMRRFHPVVEVHARRFGVPAAERVNWVAELLHDVALTLARGRAQARLSLTAYLIGACARKACGAVRAERARAVHERAALQDLGGVGEQAVASVCSEGSLRDSYGPGWEAPLLSPPLEQLVSALDEGVTAEERQLLAWRGQLISYSQMAQWLGVSRGAVKARVRRLVRRLVDVSLRFGATLELEDRRELLRFLRRSDAVDDERLVDLQVSRPGGARAPVAIMPRRENRRDVPESNEGAPDDAA